MLMLHNLVITLAQCIVLKVKWTRLKTTYHKRALAIREKQLSPDHADVALCYNHLDEIYRAKNKLDQAKEYHEHSRPFLVTTVYRPPNAPSEFFDHFEKLIKAIDDENKEMYILGDPNCDMLKTDEDSSVPTKKIKTLYVIYEQRERVFHRDIQTRENNV